jgi:hypothetical protein
MHAVPHSLASCRAPQDAAADTGPGTRGAAPTPPAPPCKAALPAAARAIRRNRRHSGSSGRARRASKTPCTASRGQCIGLSNRGVVSAVTCGTGSQPCTRMQQCVPQRPDASPASRLAAFLEPGQRRRKREASTLEGLDKLPAVPQKNLCTAVWLVDSCTHRSEEHRFLVA